MPTDDYYKLLLTVFLQFVASFAGCAAAFLVWKHVLQGVAIIH